MAKVEFKPKLILTQKELDTLTQARKIITEIDDLDENGIVFDQVDNYDSGFWFIITAIENLEYIAEVE